MANFSLMMSTMHGLRIDPNDETGHTQALRENPKTSDTMGSRSSSSSVHSLANIGGGFDGIIKSVGHGAGTISSTSSSSSTSSVSSSRSNPNEEFSGFNEFIDSYPLKAGTHGPPPTMHANCGTVGLKNLGNTCFMNSILQCLSFTLPLTSYMLDKSKKDKCKKSPMKGMLFDEYRALITKLWSEQAPSSINPKLFKMQIGRFAPRFLGYQQQDSQEFLRFLLDGLHEDLNRVTKKPPYKEDPKVAKLTTKEQAMYFRKTYAKRESSPILDCFGGQLRSTLCCTQCGYESNTWDPFLDLSLPFPDEGPATASGSGFAHRRADQDRASHHILSCFERFTKDEVMDGDEMPRCDGCKNRCKCVKSLRIEVLPPVLVVHIKRFSYTSIRGSKISKQVDFPLEALTLKQFCTSESDSSRSVYDLYAVSNHYGNLRGGHYTAYCKHPSIDNHWFEFDDSHVRVAKDSMIGGPEAYVLFYRRRS
eukprot:m.109526 g.109526  ORF g.109526 m.109526 type:complete len:478 (+) comp27964_c0_seq1:165-1598(+)